jgi:hypothetical protein
MPQLLNSHFFLVCSPITHTFCIILAGYWCQQHKRFYPDASQFRTPCFSSLSVWNLCLPRCTFFGPNKWKSLGAKSVVRRIVHDFPVTVASFAFIKCAICGGVLSCSRRWSLTVSQLFSSELHGEDHCKASYCITVHWLFHLVEENSYE